MRSHLSSHSTSRARAVLLLAAASALLPVLGACGADDDRAAAGSDRSDRPATTVAGDAVRDEGQGPTVRFAASLDGQRFAGAVPLVMEADGVTIEEAGQVREGAGHFHVVADNGCVDPGEAIPKDLEHTHFGKGQTEDEVFLPAGTHTLCLQVGDGAHVAQDLTDVVTVHVGVEDREEWCAVAREVDELTDGHSFEDSDFVELQDVYAKGRALVDQLREGLDHVDPAARGDVGAALDHMWDVSTAVVDAADREAAAPVVEALVADRPAEMGSAATWIGANCEVA